MIEKMTRQVFHAKTKGRSYLTKRAAVHAETMAIIKNKYPDEDFEYDTGHSFCCENMDGFTKLYRRMKRVVERSII